MIEVPFATRRVVVRRGHWAQSYRVMTNGTIGIFHGGRKRIALRDKWPNADAIEVDMTF